MNEQIRAIIIDDEFRARKALRNLIEKFIDGVTIVAEADKVTAGVEAIRSEKPDLVFLDIQMPTQDGFALLEDYVLPPFEVIFTTAFEKYAIKAMRLKALDYLLKPIDVDELSAALDRYRQGRTATAPSTTDAAVATQISDQEQIDKVVLPTEEGFLLTDVQNILRCEASGSYTVFHLADGRQVVVTRHLKIFDQQFEVHKFHRVHHKELVNLQHVNQVNSRENYLTLTNGAMVPISVRKKSALLKRLRGGH